MKHTNSYKIIIKCMYILVAAILFMEMGTLLRHEKEIPTVSPGNVAVFYTEMPGIQPIKKVDATDTYIFFAYHTDAAIAVYTMDGQYQYSLAFHKGSNGTMEMRCENNLLYVKDYSGYELILDGAEVQAIYVPEEAEHSTAWFQQESNNVFCRNNRILTADGVCLMDVPGKIA